MKRVFITDDFCTRVGAASLCLVLLGVLATGPALAEDAPPRPAQERWYGWQILVGDGVAAGLVTAGVITHERTLSWGGTLAYIVNGAAWHVIHDAPERSPYSLGARIVSPLLFGYLGLQVGGCINDEGVDNPGCTEGWAVGGLISGTAVGMAYDVVQSFEPVEARPLVTLGAAGTPVFGVGGRF